MSITFNNDKKKEKIIAQFTLNEIKITLTHDDWIPDLDNYVKGCVVLLKHVSSPVSVYKFYKLEEAQECFVRLMTLATKYNNEIIAKDSKLKYVDKQNRLYTVDFSPAYYNLLIVEGHGIEIEKIQIYGGYSNAKEELDNIIEKDLNPSFWSIIFGNNK